MNNEYEILNLESGKDIPVLRTLDIHFVPFATNIIGALHLLPIALFAGVFQPAAESWKTLSDNQWIWNEKPAAAPRNICSNECNTFGMKVQRTET